MQTPKPLFWTEEEMQRLDREGEQIARSLKSKAAQMRFPSDESLKETCFCPHSSAVEHILGKNEVTGSNPVRGILSCSHRLNGSGHHPLKVKIRVQIPV